MVMTSRGLTLIEAVVATAVVMTIALAATRAVAGIESTTAVAGGRAAAEAAVSARIALLRSLPFSRADGEASAPDAVSRVFPHAAGAPDSPDAFFAGQARDGCPPGTFFSSEAVADGRMTTAATFVVATIVGFQPASAARLSGYDSRATQLPSSALLVRVSVAYQTGARSGTVTRSTLLTERPSGLCRLATPAEGAT